MRLLLDNDTSNFGPVRMVQFQCGLLTKATSIVFELKKNGNDMVFKCLAIRGYKGL